MCIKHQEWYEYFPEGYKYQLINENYHFNSSCVKLHHRQFVPHHLQIPTDLNLFQAHKEILQCHFSIFCLS